MSLRKTYAGGAPLQEYCEYLSQYKLILLWNPPTGFHRDVIFIKLAEARSVFVCCISVV